MSSKADRIRFGQSSGSDDTLRYDWPVWQTMQPNIALMSTVQSSRMDACKGVLWLGSGQSNSGSSRREARG
jgi:hypothetical protein